MANQTDYVKGLEIVTEDGVATPLWGLKYTMHLDGTGLPSVRRITQRAPLQHGVLDKGFRLEPRRMTLTLFLHDDTQRGVDDLRDIFTYRLAPTNKPLILRITKNSGSIRDIECYVDGMIDFPQSQRIGTGQPVIIPLFAPDPTFFNPTQEVNTASLSSGSVNITIPLGGYTWDDWPLIEVTGPITNLDIDHAVVDTLESLTIIGVLPAGETWQFDLRPGRKTLQRMSDGANRMSFLNTDTIQSLSTLRILSDKTARAHNAAASANVFAFAGTSTTAASSVSIKWFRRYLSL